ncbi:winged helix-turn-helix domain-containing protein [Tenacibaculum amylolyticum]|uniref:winged helix-turn-helix domain-containing protein n=1 Tax=Tenacibaculum amylolyticum TaxID=104269 RepID=UPI0038B5C81C
MCLIIITSCKRQQNKQASEITKVALRNVGHELLIANDDFTSLVLPVKEIENSKYQIAFATDLVIEPSQLVTIIKKNFEKGALSEQYLVEVRQCLDKEIAYSYVMDEQIEEQLIPCAGRNLPKKCYTITIEFRNNKEQITADYRNYIILILLILFAILLYLFKLKKIKNQQTISIKQQGIPLGNFVFYPEQNSIVFKEIEKSLSKKECELLAIFIESPNQTIKREILIKKVWEDNGVVVGRSLDTYISKLRKKLKEDDRIQLINIHGVGYKLTIDN